jgi:fructose-1-phosphate kinase PfkB-like protein
MIITVTLNTAIDKTLSVPNFRLGRRHRTVEQTTMPGGKGVNVARVLKTLGAPVIATGLAGGATGTRSSRCSATSCGSARSRAPTPP